MERPALFSGMPFLWEIRRTRTIRVYAGRRRFPFIGGELSRPHPGWFASAALIGKLDTTATRTSVQVVEANLGNPKK
jgi:hypothetical protein